jgi:hypothetical protein
MIPGHFLIRLGVFYIRCTGISVTTGVESSAVLIPSVPVPYSNIYTTVIRMVTVKKIARSAVKQILDPALFFIPPFGCIKWFLLGPGLNLKANTGIVKSVDYQIPYLNDDVLFRAVLWIRSRIRIRKDPELLPDPDLELLPDPDPEPDP